MNWGYHLQSSAAGRHGAYGTQFYRSSIPHRSRAVMRQAVSLKSLERRLVLPLDQGLWTRALEVLSAGYAKLGRRPEHYQQVIRAMVSAVAPSTNECGTSSFTAASVGRRQCIEAMEQIDALRDQAYAGDIPSNSSLFVTFIWGYCLLGAPLAARDSFFQALRRSGFSPASTQHALDLLLPSLCRAGYFDEAQEVLCVVREKRATSFVADAAARKYSALLAEAAGLRGKWSDALKILQCDKKLHEGAGRATDSGVGSAVKSEAVPSGKPFSSLSSSALKSLWRESLHEWQMEGMSSLEKAKALWNELVVHREETIESTEIYELINELGAAQKRLEKDTRTPLSSTDTEAPWKEVIRWFAYLFLPSSCSLEKYGVASTKILRPYEFVLPPKAQLAHIPLTPVFLNLVFSSFPEAVLEEGPNDEEGCAATIKLIRHFAIPAAKHPQEMYALLNDILLYCDDAQVTNHMMARVGPALIQLGHIKRTVQLLRQASLLSAPVSAMRSAPSVIQDLQRALLRLLYCVHAIQTEGTLKDDGLQVALAFPQWFPPDLSQRKAIYAVSTDVQVHPLKAQVRSPTGVFRSSDDLDEAMKTNFSRIQQGPKEFRGDAEKDPRPPPIGLHDKASGWNYFGRGGEKAFFNSRHTPHPFSMHPKVMRSLADPYRSWKPRENSIHAHKENVIKWNGRSSV